MRHFVRNEEAGISISASTSRKSRYYNCLGVDWWKVGAVESELDPILWRKGQVEITLLLRPFWNNVAHERSYTKPNQ